MFQSCNADKNFTEKKHPVISKEQLNKTFDFTIL